MIFGDRKRFAIEFELDSNYGGVWLYGKVCYWVLDQQVGDYDLGTSLRDVLFGWDAIATDAGDRCSDSLLTVDTAELVRLLYCALYGNDCDDADELFHRGIEEQWRKHLVKPSVDVFDDWQVYLVQCSRLTRCVCRRYETSYYIDCQLEYGEFDQTLKSALKVLTKLYDFEVAKQE